MDKTYTIKCSDCGIIDNNHSPLYCDNCGEPIVKIKFGNSWYDADDLENSSMDYNFEVGM